MFKSVGATANVRVTAPSTFARHARATHNFVVVVDCRRHSILSSIFQSAQKPICASPSRSSAASCLQASALQRAKSFLDLFGRQFAAYYFDVRSSERDMRLRPSTRRPFCVERKCEDSDSVRRAPSLAHSRPFAAPLVRRRNAWREGRARQRARGPCSSTLRVETSRLLCVAGVF